ncbi:MAG: sorbosone dehydrogenase family protein [Pyrinomonadaceae bacterium]
MYQIKILTFCVLIFAASSVFGQPDSTPNRIALKNGKTFDLNLPADFEVIPSAEGFKRVRFFAKAPDGRIFVTDMYNLTDNNRGVIYALDGWNSTSGKFATVTPYLSNLKNPNSVLFYRDQGGQDWIYIAETHQLTRRKFRSRETEPSDRQPQVLATFPDYGLSYKYGGWHLTRTIAFSPNGKLYVSVGSSCNACVEKEKVRASIVEMNPDGTGQRIFASGLRNAVGLRWIGNFPFATNQGSDHLGLQKPDETFYAVKDGADYGWPYCHSSGGKVFGDLRFRRPSGCSGVPAPYAAFPARSSALGFDYFDDSDSPDLIRNAFLVSLHGSTNKAIGHGYKIVIMRKNEGLIDLVTGFLKAGKVLGRPCDIIKLDANSFLFSDDHTGVVYLVRKKGTQTTVRMAASAHNIEPVPDSPDRESAGSYCISAVLLVAGSLLRLAR